MKRAAIVAVVVMTVCGIGYFAMTRLRAPSTEDEVKYRISKVTFGTVKKTVSATGVLMPWTTVDIKSKAGGRVDALLVDEGSLVTKDQILAKIDPSDTQLNVNTAQADIDSAAARVAQNRKTHELQVKQSTTSIETAEAQAASAAASLRASEARLRSAELAARTQPALSEAAISQAKANLNSAEQQRAQLDATNPQEQAATRAAVDQANANVHNARLNLDRQKTLVAKGFVAQSAVDAAQATYDVAAATLSSAQEKLRTLAAAQKAGVEQAEARVRQAQAQLDNAVAQRVDIETRKQSLEEARAVLKQSQAALDQAEANLRQARSNKANDAIKALDIATAKASMQRASATMVNARNTLEQTTVRAPADGVILKKYVEQGTIISSALSFAATGNNILQLGDITRMYVDVTVDETDIANVDDGGKVEVSIDAYPGLPFEGTVTRISPQAVVEQNVTNVHVRVEIDNSAPSFRLLKPGMNSTCEFVKEEKDNCVIVPLDAIRSDDDGKFIEVTNGTGKVAPVDPKVGGEADPNLLVGVKVDKRRVEPGIEGNDGVELPSGAKEGEIVVIQRIEPGPKQAGSPFGGGGPGGMGRGRGR